MFSALAVKIGNIIFIYLFMAPMCEQCVEQRCFVFRLIVPVSMDPIILSKNMYLLDGSFISGIRPYVEIDTVVKHPLWGSNLLFNDKQAVINGHKDYIRGGYKV